MADNEHIRIEVAYEGGQIIAALVAPDTADALERAVNAGAGGMLELATTDGRLTVSVPRVVYVKRYTKGAQPGFLTA